MQRKTTQSEQSIIPKDTTVTRYSQDTIQTTTKSEDKKLMRFEEIQIYKDNSNVAYRVLQRSRHPGDQQQSISQIDVDKKD